MRLRVTFRDIKGFEEIRHQLFYKKDLYGNVVHIIDGFYPSSKMCSHCDAIKSDLTLADRTYVCEICGLIINRDVNAAINLDKVGRAHPEPTDACGLDGSGLVFQQTRPTSQEEARSESTDE